jgi:hypothetical protein
VRLSSCEFLINTMLRRIAITAATPTASSVSLHQLRAKATSSAVQSSAPSTPKNCSWLAFVQRHKNSFPGLELGAKLSLLGRMYRALPKSHRDALLQEYAQQQTRRNNSPVSSPSPTKANRNVHVYKDFVRDNAARLPDDLAVTDRMFVLAQVWKKRQFETLAKVAKDGTKRQ